MGFYTTYLSPTSRFRRKPVRGIRSYRTRAEIHRRKPNWLDLPEGILELIINKLHFPDQVRALAVCKTWQDSKDYVRTSKRLPWVMSHRRTSTKEEKHSFVCELIDPYTRKVHIVSNSVDLSTVSAFSSKNGWFLVDQENSFKVFWYNPFTNRIISYPFRMDESVHLTMKATPTSPDCEIFLVYIRDDDSFGELSDYLLIESCCSSTGFFEKTEIVIRNEMIQNESIYSILYMKGIIYCLFCSGKLYRFGLEDKSWESLSSEYPEVYQPWHDSYTSSDAWLLEINDNLMLVTWHVEGKRYKWMIFRFVWSEMTWVRETGLKSCAIYISGRMTFSAPLTDQNGKELEGCRVFYYKHFVDAAGGWGFKCFSLNEAGGTQRITSKEYGCIEMPYGYNMSFIMPPYFGV